MINEYLDRHGPHGRVRVDRGAWNAGQPSGHRFRAMDRIARQPDALARLVQLSEAVQAASHDLDGDERPAGVLEHARWCALRDEPTGSGGRDLESRAAALGDDFRTARVAGSDRSTLGANDRRWLSSAAPACIGTVRKHSRGGWQPEGHMNGAR